MASGSTSTASAIVTSMTTAAPTVGEQDQLNRGKVLSQPDGEIPKSNEYLENGFRVLFGAMKMYLSIINSNIIYKYISCVQ